MEIVSLSTSPSNSVRNCFIYFGAMLLRTHMLKIAIFSWWIILSSYYSISLFILLIPFPLNSILAHFIFAIKCFSISLIQHISFFCPFIFCLSVKLYFTCVSYKNPEAVFSIHSDYLYHFIGEYNLFIFIVITHLFTHISTLLVVFSFYHIFLCFLPPFCSLMG